LTEWRPLWEGGDNEITEFWEAVYTEVQVSGGTETVGFQSLAFKAGSASTFMFFSVFPGFFYCISQQSLQVLL
jgi:hypothetical protein